MGFLLGAGQVNDAIVASLLCFTALHAGAPFGYADWVGLLAFAALGNMVGGLGLVTVLRLLQVQNKVIAERNEGTGQTAQAHRLLRRLAMAGGEASVPVGHDLGGGVAQIGAARDPGRFSGTCCPTRSATAPGPCPASRPRAASHR